MITIESTSFDYMGTYANAIGNIYGPQPALNAISGHGWIAVAVTQVAGLYDGSGVALSAPNELRFQFTPGGHYDSLAFVLFYRLKLSNVTSKTVLGNPSGPGGASWAIETTAAGKLIVKATGTTTLTGTTVLAVDTVYDIEVAGKIHASSGKITIRINGVEDAASTGVNTGTGTINTLTWHNASLVVDDVMCRISNDATTDSGDYADSDFPTYQASGHRVPRLGTLWVAGDGNYTTWLDGDGGGGADYTHLDETAADSTTTYLHTPGSGGAVGPALRQSVTFGATASDTGDISYIIPRIACSHDVGTEGKFVNFIRYGGTNYDETNTDDYNVGQIAGVAKGHESRIWLTHPTAGSWTKALLDGLEYGWYPYDPDEDDANHDSNRVSQVVIEYLWYVAIADSWSPPAELYALPITGVGW
jgi:hypothetical protein